MCKDMLADMLKDLRIDVCIDTCLGMHMRTCVYSCAESFNFDMCAGMRTYMCVDMCACVQRVAVLLLWAGHAVVVFPLQMIAKNSTSTTSRTSASKLSIVPSNISSAHLRTHNRTIRRTLHCMRSIEHSVEHRAYDRTFYRTFHRTRARAQTGEMKNPPMASIV